MKARYIILFLLLFIPTQSFATYTSVQNWNRTGTGYTGSVVTDVSDYIGFSFTSTTTARYIDTIQTRLCRTNATGDVQLEVFYVSLNQNIRASSSVPYTAIYDCYASNPATTTITFAPPLDWSSGVEVFFRFTARNGIELANSPWNYPTTDYNFRYSTSSGAYAYWDNSSDDTYDRAEVILYGIGTEPVQNLSAPTPDLQPCGITDISGCVANALSWAFVPSDSALDDFLSLPTEIGGKYPIALVTDLYSTLQFLDTNASSTSVAGTWYYSNGIASTSVQMLPLSQLATSTSGMVTTMRSYIGYALWFMYIFGSYKLAMTIFA